jgi:cob(I)alamin adenosyltransferase
VKRPDSFNANVNRLITTAEQQKQRILQLEQNGVNKDRAITKVGTELAAAKASNAEQQDRLKAKDARIAELEGLVGASNAENSKLQNQVIMSTTRIAELEAQMGGGGAAPISVIDVDILDENKSLTAQNSRLRGELQVGEQAALVHALRMQLRGVKRKLEAYKKRQPQGDDEPEYLGTTSAMITVTHEIEDTENSGGDGPAGGP